MITLEKYSGAAVERILQPLAKLRLVVFHDFPYLYDGSLDYEMRYLQTYVKSSRSVVVLAKQGDQVIGATTGLPLADEEADLQGNFAEHGFPIQEVFYFGESIILQEFRGQGIGAKFFDAREAHAKQLGYRYTCFCAVVRPEDHPRRPAFYQSPESLWQRRGYQRLDGVQARYKWKDLDHDEETYKTMQFWLKEI